MQLCMLLPAIHVINLATRVLIVPENFRRVGKVQVEAVVVEKAVAEVFLVVAEEIITGEIRAEVEAEAKKVVKANHPIIITHVLVICVIRQDISLRTARTQKNLLRCLRSAKMIARTASFQKDAKNMKMTNSA